MARPGRAPAFPAAVISSSSRSLPTVIRTLCSALPVTVISTVTVRKPIWLASKR